MVSPALSVTCDQDTTWPVDRFASAGPVHGPVMTTTGGEPKLPLLTQDDTAGGGAAASEKGTLKGTVNSPATGGGAVIRRFFCTVPYLRMSGATRPIVKVTSASVGHFSGTCPERLTRHCFGTGSSYLRTAISPAEPTGTACCSCARATSRKACVWAAALQVRVRVRAANHCGAATAPWSPARGMTPAPCTGAESHPSIFCHSHAVPLLSTWPNSMSRPALSRIRPPVQ